ncbi:uncharacterized protein LOC116304754 [Actinia tenebrosa]|uniref:Uncharacterized protein LOC116304754 n=1 Tax=Actinia tenebrosa TaxID=6105 RepID=A0A6P8IT74_ACTTE|nr:uncharacterized protein LOC116304754 [Actinia tenebrosa]
MTTTLGLLRFSILLSALCLSSVTTNCPSLNYERNSFFVNSDVIYDHLLAHSTFLVTTTINEVECFRECHQNCSCLSMNYLKGGQQNNCLLNNSTEKMSPELLQFRVSWKYYHFVRENMGNISSNTGCLNGCCRNNPCVHGGTCTELCANQKRRFQCKCKNRRYTGHRCEIYKPRSCADLKEDGISKNRWFEVYLTSNSVGTMVYCDFRSSDNITWTMVLSFGVHPFGGYDACKNLKQDRKIKYSFYQHNIGSSEKLALRKRSPHWRVTCEYDKHHTVFDNYIVAKFDHIDLTSLPNGVQCKRFEEINVLKTKCTNCSATVVRDCTRYQYFALLSERSMVPNCTTNISFTESYFGNAYYYIFQNPLFPCNRYRNSTTQYWFGSQ